MVHPGGRPRTVCPEPDELIELGKEMVQWCIDNQPIHLSKWYSIEKDIPDNVWDTMRKRSEFVHYYTKALKIVGYQYLDKDSQVDRSVRDRWQRVYFKDLKQEEDETAVFNSNLKKEETKAVDEKLVKNHRELIDSLENLRKSYSDSNSNND